MAGAQKGRAKKERDSHRNGDGGSSNGESSSSGKASGSAPRSVAGSTTSRLTALDGSSRAGFDGNRDPDSESGSRPPSRPTSRTGSPSVSTRNPATSSVIVNPKNLDLGMAAWATIRGYDMPSAFPKRPAKASSLGIAKPMGLNTFNVTSIPEREIHQYEVLIGNGAEKRGLIVNVWKSKAVQDKVGKGVIFDCSRLAWGLSQIEREHRITVDLDEEKGRTVRPGGKENKHRIMIRQTNNVRFDVLRAYLEGKVQFDNACLEAITFLDHLLRETPQSKFTQIKRSYFSRGQQRFPLGGGVEAFKGVYQSMRIVHSPSGPMLSVNVDVANGTFWTENLLQIAALQLTGRRDVNDLINALKQGDKGRAGIDMKRLRKLSVVAAHRGSGSQDRYIIDKFIYQSAKDYKFPVRDTNTGKETMTSLSEYFAKKYNVRLQYPELPLVKMTKGKNTVLPMEVLKIEQNQRYVYKMDERQTSNMIKFAVTPPNERWNAIDHGLKMLDWQNDPYLKNYGMTVNPNRVTVQSRLLPNPKVQFGSGPHDPKTSGRWDLKGKKFLTPNTAPLKSWGVCVITGTRGGKPDKTIIENFLREFIKIYTMHGGRVENKSPAMSLGSSNDVGAAVTSVWNAAGNQTQSRPQMLLFVLPDKDSITYGRIKRSCECRYGVVSQCMQYAHVQKCQAQYISNVCMKFNAKLGGVTARAIGLKSGGPGGAFGNIPTLVVGADVSHAAPGSQTPSMAAMTCSIDKLATRYAAACETNGFRVEMITKDNINAMLKPMMQHWCKEVNGGNFPGRIIYFRDGVSEGQYQHVLQQEVQDMKALIKTANPQLNVPFVVIVGSKRHNIRFFPGAGAGDRNNNPLPGTLVETGCTHPFDNDFYLCAHSAIKGTARPVHYYVLMNEANMSNDELQMLIYEHSYQYIRATTPVSIHPAIYYAHLASNRAVSHDPKYGGSSDGTPSVKGPGSQTGSGGRSGGSSSNMPTEFDKLLVMPNQGSIRSAMWYV